MEFNETNIERLAGLMKTNNIESLKLEQEDEKLILKTTRKSKVKMVQAPSTVDAIPSISVIAKAPTVAAAPINNFAKIKSPMVGTFYTSASPDSPNYVKEGQSISVGDTLCIVEAMKLMNEIKSSVSGKVVKICSKSGSGVKSGDELFWIEEN